MSKINSGVLLFFYLLLCGIALSNTHGARHRRTTRTMNRPDLVLAGGRIRIIRNQTFSCDELLGKSGLQHMDFDGDILMEILRAVGGDFVPSYMARSLDEAKRNFRHFVGGLGPSPEHDPFDPIADNWGSKERAERHLRRFFRHLPREVATPFDTETKQKLGQKVENPGNRGRKRAPKENRPGSQQVQSVMQAANVKNVTNTSDHTQGDYLFRQCFPRRNLERGHLRLCETCAVTISLPSMDFYPHLFNGAECTVNDPRCLYVQVGIAHGECRQSEITLNILQRSQEACSLALLDGDTVVVDDWHLTSWPLPVGCECFVDQHSFLAQFV